MAIPVTTIRESDSDAVMADPDLAAGTRADGAVSVNQNDVTEQLDSNYAALQAEHVALQNTHEKMATENRTLNGRSGSCIWIGRA